MRNFAWTLSLIFGTGLAACSSDTTAAPGTTVDGGAPDGAIVSTPPVRNRSLGMNDVSFLVPLPTDDNAVLFRASDPSADGSPFLSEALFTRVTTVDGHGPAELSVPHKDLQITAVRFDVCDRNTSAPCGPNEEDASGSCSSQLSKIPRTILAFMYFTTYRVRNLRASSRTCVPSPRFKQNR